MLKWNVNNPQGAVDSSNKETTDEKKQVRSWIKKERAQC